MGHKNSKLTNEKHQSGEGRNRTRIAIIILSYSFIAFLVMAILAGIFQPQLISKMSEYSADFCKVSIGAVLGWLFSKSGDS